MCKGKFKEHVCLLAPLYGYFPNSSKTHVLAKSQHTEAAKEIFKDTGITVSTEGERYLGGAMGTGLNQQQSRPHTKLAWQHRLVCVSGAEFRLRTLPLLLYPLQQKCLSWHEQLLHILHLVLVPLDKCPGVRPVGIGEVVRRIIGKTVMRTVKRASTPEGPAEPSV